MAVMGLPFWNEVTAMIPRRATVGAAGPPGQRRRRGALVDTQASLLTYIAISADLPVTRMAGNHITFLFRHAPP